VNEAKARQIVTARSGGRCELCRNNKADSWAHRRSRGQGGLWTPSNGLALCGSGTSGCHGWTEHNPTLAAAGGWRLVHDHRDPAEVPVWLAPALTWPGWWLLDDDGMYLPAPDADTPQLPPTLAGGANPVK
jgi:hypothetical protein